MKKTNKLSLNLACYLISGCGALNLITGCSTPSIPPIQPPEITEEAHFSKSGTEAVSASWWTAFNDPALNKLIEQALSQNLTLAQSWSRLSQAESLVKAGGAARFPSLFTTVSSRRQWQNLNGPSDSSDTTSGSTGLTSSYELDLWGKVRAQYESSYFDYLTSEQDLQTASISLAAEVANTWFTLTEKWAQRELLTAQYQNAQQTLESIKVRFNNGSRNATDLLQQQQVIESRNALLILNQSEIAVLEHSLSILLGKDPSKGSYQPTLRFPDFPDLPSTGIPAQTLSHRPDIQSAWYAIQAADRDVAIAIDSRFPTITLGGTLSAAFGSPVNWFENWIKALTASISLPIIDGGSRRSEVDRRKALLGTALLRYENAYLTAMKEVEDALIQEQQQSDYLASLDQQIKLADQVFQQTLLRYQQGNQTYLQVLTAQDSLHSLKRTQLTALRTLFSYRIALYRAIGGNLTPPHSERWDRTISGINH